MSSFFEGKFLGANAFHIISDGEQYHFLRGNTVPRSGADPWDTVFPLEKIEGTFRVKAFVRISNGKQYPKRRRRLLGHSLSLEKLEAMFGVKAWVRFSDGKQCPKRRRE